jgi:hypothetical protein
MTFFRRLSTTGSPSPGRRMATCPPIQAQPSIAQACLVLLDDGGRCANGHR